MKNIFAIATYFVVTLLLSTSALVDGDSMGGGGKGTPAAEQCFLK